MGTARDDRLTRRGLLSRLGGLGGGAVLASGLVAPPAGAAPPGDGLPAGDTVATGTRATPAGLAPIASTPLEGVSYRFLTQFDFMPERGARAFNASGGYGVLDSTMWASMDLPPGAVLSDLEWYTANATDVTTRGRVWQAGSGSLPVVVADVVVRAGTTVHATRRVVPGTSSGPFPHGTKLQLGMPTTSANVVNGVRVGFAAGALSTVLLPLPQRVYDSRIAPDVYIRPGETRTIDLSRVLPRGAVGVLLNLSLTGTQGTGTLRIGPGLQVPAVTAGQWSFTGDKATTSVTTRVSRFASIALKSVASTAPTHVVLDVVGYLV